MSPLIKTETKVERRQWIYRGRETYGYCEDHGQYQLLIKRWMLCGITIWKRVLDREEIPAHVSIELATLGSTDWKSKFHSYIR